MNGLVMIGHTQDTDSEDESGDLSFTTHAVLKCFCVFGVLFLGESGGGGEDELPEK